MFISFLGVNPQWDTEDGVLERCEYLDLKTPLGEVPGLPSVWMLVLREPLSNWSGVPSFSCLFLFSQEQFLPPGLQCKQVSIISTLPVLLLIWACLYLRAQYFSTLGAASSIGIATALWRSMAGFTLLCEATVAWKAISFSLARTAPDIRAAPRDTNFFIMLLI